MLRVVLAEPARLGDLEIPLAQRREVGVQLGMVQRRLHADFLPHGGDGHLHDLVVRPGDVPQRDAQRVLVVVASGEQQRLGRLRIRPRFLHRADVAGNHGRHERRARHFVALQHPLGDALAIQRQGERPAHPHVVEGRLRGVEHQIHHRQQRREANVRRHLLAQPVQFRWRKVADDVQLAIPIAVEGRVPVRRGEVGHGIEMHGSRLAEVRILRQAHDRLRLPFRQHERAVAHHVPRLHPVVAEFRHDMPWHRIARRIDQAFRKERERLGEPNHQGVRIAGGHAKRLGRRFAGVHLRRVFDGVQEVGQTCRRARIHQAPKGEDEVLGGHRRAVRPARVLAQVERPLEAVCRRAPTVRGGGNNAPVRVVRGEPLEEIGEDFLLQVQVVAVGIQRQRFAAIADAQLGAEAEHGRQGDGRAGQRSREPCRRSLHRSLTFSATPSCRRGPHHSRPASFFAYRQRSSPQSACPVALRFALLHFGSLHC